jgi:putative membrane protein
MPYRITDPTLLGPVDGGLWWLHALFTLLVVVALVAGAVLLARGWQRRPVPPAVEPRSSAVDVLDLRYARGEIERDDYLQRRADLLDRSPLTAGALPAAPPEAG